MKNMILSTILATICATAGAACIDLPLRVNGFVVDENRRPVAGARIVITWQTDKGGAGGADTFADDNGSYRARISTIDYLVIDKKRAIDESSCDALITSARIRVFKENFQTADQPLHFKDRNAQISFTMTPLRDDIKR